MMTQKKSAKKASEQPGFESSLARLEEIVQELEGGDIALSESIARYEEGVTLLKGCYKVLEKAEVKIELLSGVDAAGNPLLEPFEEESAGERDDEDLARAGAAAKRSPAKRKKRGPNIDVDTPGSLF